MKSIRYVGCKCRSYSRSVLFGGNFKSFPILEPIPSVLELHHQEYAHISPLSLADREHSVVLIVSLSRPSLHMKSGDLPW